MLWPFQAVCTPGTFKLVTIGLCPAEAIRVALRSLNMSDHLGHIQEILFRDLMLPIFFCNHRFHREVQDLFQRPEWRVPGQVRVMPLEREFVVAAIDLALSVFTEYLF